MTANQAETWRGRLIQWATRKRAQAAGGARAKVKAAKRSLKEPYIATTDFLLPVQNALHAGRNGRGLEQHLPLRPNRPFDDDLRQNEQLVPLLASCFDEEQTQWTGGYIAQRQWSVAWEMFKDPIHRRHNDLTKALSEAKALAWAIPAMTAMNIWFGPFQRSGCFNECLEMAEEFVALATPDCPILRAYWPRICEDRQWFEPSEADEDARAASVKTLQGERCFAIKGGKSSPSRWFSIIANFSQVRRNWHTKAFGL